MLSYVFTRLDFTALEQRVIVLSPEFPGHRLAPLASTCPSMPSKSWLEAVIGDGREPMALQTGLRLPPHPRIRPARATAGVVLAGRPPLRRKHHAWLDQLEAINSLVTCARLRGISGAVAVSYTAVISLTVPTSRSSPVTCVKTRWLPGASASLSLP